MELQQKLHEEIEQLCASGDQLADANKYTEALDLFKKAYALIPEPQTEWEATTWVTAAIGDMYFLLRQFEEAKRILSFAMHCPNAIGNPFLHFRLGQCQFELQALDQAADELTRAYALTEKELFDGEDPKYFNFLKTRIDLEET